MMQNCSKNSENVGNCLFSVAWLWHELRVCAGVALHEWQQRLPSVFFLRQKHIYCLI